MKSIKYPDGYIQCLYTQNTSTEQKALSVSFSLDAYQFVVSGNHLLEASEEPPKNHLWLKIDRWMYFFHVIGFSSIAEPLPICYKYKEAVSDLVQKQRWTLYTP